MDYVVVGGYAAELHGSTRRRVDIDVVSETGRENLTRLAGAVTELDARIRTDMVLVSGATVGGSHRGLRGRAVASRSVSQVEPTWSPLRVTPPVAAHGVTTVRPVVVAAVDRP